MILPNWFTLLMKNPKTIKRVLLFGGGALALLVGLQALQGRAPGATESTLLPAAPHPGHLASRDMVLTGLAKKNQQENLMLRQQVTALQEELTTLRHQLKQAALQPRPATLTAEQVQLIARQQIALSQQAQAAPAQPPRASPWQRVGPTSNPVRPAPSKPRPKWVTIPAGSTARAILSDGLAWISDDAVRYHTIRIEGIYTPNHQRLPLDDCHVVMRSTLAIPTEVVARLPVMGDVLSCVLPNQEVIEVPFEGYATSRDNVQGLEAKVFSNDWDILKEFGKAAIPTALARAIDGVTTLAITPLGTITQEGGSALSDTMSAISDFYIENARVYARKVIWIDPHQDIYVYFRRATQLKGVTAQLLTQAGAFDRRILN